MLRLAVFLGNPGRQYRYNRHNAGWMLAETLPFYSLLDWRDKYKGFYASLDDDRLPFFGNSTAGKSYTARDEKVHFLKPQTFMNLSGESAAAAASFFKIALDEIIVIHDEIELPFGTVSLKFSGGLGGHNGLRSMKACFSGADFWRLRIGIGRPDGRFPGKGTKGRAAGSNAETGIADWVLSDFSVAEAEMLEPVFQAGADVLIRALVLGPKPLLPEWTKKNCLAGGEDAGLPLLSL